MWDGAGDSPYKWLPTRVSWPVGIQLFIPKAYCCKLVNTCSTSGLRTFAATHVTLNLSKYAFDTWIHVCVYIYDIYVLFVVHVCLFMHAQNFRLTVHLLANPSVLKSRHCEARFVWTKTASCWKASWFAINICVNISPVPKEWDIYCDVDFSSFFSGGLPVYAYGRVVVWWGDTTKVHRILFRVDNSAGLHKFGFLCNNRFPQLQPVSIAT